MSAVISSSNIHDIKLVTDVMDNMIVKRSSPSPPSSTKRDISRKRKLQHLCLDRAYNSKATKQEIIKRGYLPRLPYKRKRGEVKTGTQKRSNRKKYPLEYGLWREQTHDGTTGSENFTQDMKRRQRTFLC
jgi:hypothetical protein